MYYVVLFVNGCPLISTERYTFRRTAQERATEQQRLLDPNGDYACRVLTERQYEALGRQRAHQNWIKRLAQSDKE